MSQQIRDRLTRAINDVNVPWGWRKRALMAEWELKSTTRRMELAERRLGDERESVMYIQLKINGKEVPGQRYAVKATRLASASRNLDKGETITAWGDGAVFTIDIPVVVDV